jgi:hypothetical protein
LEDYKNNSIRTIKDEKGKIWKTKRALRVKKELFRRLKEQLRVKKQFLR